MHLYQGLGDNWRDGIYTRGCGRTVMWPTPDGLLLVFHMRIYKQSVNQAICMHMNIHKNGHNFLISGLILMQQKLKCSVI